jgi:hypothetical protein
LRSAKSDEEWTYIGVLLLRAFGVVLEVEIVHEVEVAIEIVHEVAVAVGVAVVFGVAVEVDVGCSSTSTPALERALAGFARAR